MVPDEIPLGSFQRWSPTLFLLAAVVFVLTGLMLAVRFTTDTPMDRLLGIIGTLAFVLGFAGLLGLYPSAVTWNQSVGYALGFFGAIGLIGMVVVDLSFVVRLLGAELPPAVDALNLTRYVGLVGFVLAGGLAVQRPEHKVLGLHLLAVAVIEYVAIGVIIAGMPESTILVFVAANALVYGSIGYRLRTEGSPTRQTDRSVESAV